jgi:hypothetical protein
LDKAAESIVKVRSGIVPEELEKSPKLVAFMEYSSFWDVWYRFRYFAIFLYDFDSQDRILVAGQGRDNPLSNEDAVIRETFDKIKRELKIN